MTTDAAPTDAEARWRELRQQFILQQREGYDGHNRRAGNAKAKAELRRRRARQKAKQRARATMAV